MRALAAATPTPTLTRAFTLAVALALILATAACGSSRPRALAPVPAASAAPLPPLEYRLRSGEPWTSGSAAGRVLVIDVWATYCKPCRKAFPKLGQLAAAYPDTAVVVGVSVDEEDAVVEDFLREVPAAFLIARDPARTVQSGPLALSKLPTLLVIDRRGRIRFRGEAMAEPDYDLLPGLVSTLLAEPAE
jgi:thiol-disulfide isomerase/thioredoxin